MSGLDTRAVRDEGHGRWGAVQPGVEPDGPAKIFQNGGSQAVRLPKSCRFSEDLDEVIVRRRGKQVILEPANEWPSEFLACLGASRKLHGLIDTFASSVEVVLFDEAAAAEFGRIGNILAERGTPIGDFDVLIAAHAVAFRRTLVTNNVRHFSKVPGLSLENWA